MTEYAHSVYENLYVDCIKFADSYAPIACTVRTVRGLPTARPVPLARCHVLMAASHASHTLSPERVRASVRPQREHANRVLLRSRVSAAYRALVWLLTAMERKVLRALRLVKLDAYDSMAGTMGAPLDLDWQAIQTLCIAIGIKPAAEQLGITQYLDALYQRSKREGWLEGVPRNQPLPRTVLQPVSCVSSAPVVMANTLNNKAMEVRYNHIETALGVSREIKQLPAGYWLDKDNINILVGAGKHAALQCGYAADSRPDAPGRTFGSRSESLVIDAEFEQVSSSSTSTVERTQADTESTV